MNDGAATAPEVVRTSATNGTQAFTIFTPSLSVSSIDRNEFVEARAANAPLVTSIEK
ncbi:MAG: hypothetical protein JJU33_12560 [Phycisphaerales bacterium]|nr:hypothetical protein [Phycisphaerales bacterium]